MNTKDVIRKYRLAGVLGQESMQIVDSDDGPLVIFNRTALPLRYFESLMIYATMSVNPTGETYERFSRCVQEFWQTNDCIPENVNLGDDERYTGYQIYSWFREAIKIKQAPRELAEYFTDHRELAFWTYIEKRDGYDVKSTQG
jgi:hypothetical protein